MLTYGRAMQAPMSLALLGLILLAAGCATTEVKTARRAPAAAPVRFAKVLAVVAASDSGLRRSGETALCAQMPSVTCTPSFQVLGDGPLPSRDAARADLTKAGFDGAVVMRPLGERQRQTYVPPTYSYANYGFYRTAYPMMASPGYVRSDRLVRIETSIYDLGTDQLLWVGTTETVNPSNVTDLIEDVAKAVAADMRSHGLLPPA